MTWLYRATATLTTRLSTAEVVARLRSNSEPRRRLMAALFGRSPLFLGRVSDEGFRLKISAVYANTWRPVVIGTLRARDGETELRLEMKLEPLAVAFTWFWLAGGLIIACGLLGQPHFRWPFLGFKGAVFGFTVVGFAFTRAFFELDRRISERRLRALLDAQGPQVGAAPEW